MCYKNYYIAYFMLCFMKSTDQVELNLTLKAFLSTTLKKILFMKTTVLR